MQTVDVTGKGTRPWWRELLGVPRRMQSSGRLSTRASSAGAGALLPLAAAGTFVSAATAWILAIGMALGTLYPFVV